MPRRVLSNRGNLSVTEALCFWLCRDQHGPRKTPKQAANLLGMKHGPQVSNALQRAEEKMLRAGRVCL